MNSFRKVSELVGAILDAAVSATKCATAVVNDVTVVAQSAHPLAQSTAHLLNASSRWLDAVARDIDMAADDYQRSLDTTAAGKALVASLEDGAVLRKELLDAGVDENMVEALVLNMDSAKDNEEEFRKLLYVAFKSGLTNNVNNLLQQPTTNSKSKK